MTIKLFNGGHLFKPLEESEIKGIRFNSVSDSRYAEFDNMLNNVFFEVVLNSGKVENSGLIKNNLKNLKLNTLYNNVVQAVRNGAEPEDYCMKFSTEENGLYKLDDRIDRDKRIDLGNGESVTAGFLYDTMMENVESGRYLTKGSVNTANSIPVILPKFQYGSYKRQTKGGLDIKIQDSVGQLLNGFLSNYKKDSVLPVREIAVNPDNYKYKNGTVADLNKGINEYVTPRMMSAFKEYIETGKVPILK